MSQALPSSTSFGANITPTYWSASQILGHSEGRAGYSDDDHGHKHHHHHGGYPHDQYYTYHSHNHLEDDEDMIDDYVSDLVNEVLEVSTSKDKIDLNISDETSSTLPMLICGHQDFVHHEKEDGKRKGEEPVSRNTSQV